MKYSSERDSASSLEVFAPATPCLRCVYRPSQRKRPWTSSVGIEA